MRLLTQNLLVCNVRACVETASREGGTSRAFPLRVVPAATGGLEERKSEFSAARVLALLPKLDWTALRATAAQMGVAELPVAPPPDPAADEPFLRALHTLVLDVHLVEGALVCPHCGREYPVHGGIPNMLLGEDEL